MTANNPYAPSRASLKSGRAPGMNDGEIWRDDDRVIVAHGVLFPHRCVKCNEPAEEPQKIRKVYWHHPTLYLLFFFWAIVYFIVALIVRKSAEIDPGLCTEHRKKRQRWIAIGWIGSLSGLLLLPVIATTLQLDSGWWMVLGAVCFFGFAIVGIVKSRILYPKRIDDRFVRLSGAGDDFLDSLPDFVSY
jgi:MFS family permease